MKASSRYSLPEEVAHSITHGLGVILGIAALAILVTLGALRGTARHVVSFSIYGASFVLLYLSSTLYHALSHPRAKRILRIFDHASIGVLIAGTYTPFTLITLRGGWGWTLFGITWGLAAAGALLKIFHTGRFRALSVAVHILMGWMIVIALRPLVTHLDPGGIAWLLAGGLCYTGGAAFYLCRRLPFQHAVWHAFVLAGSICHFFAILLYVLPPPAP